MECFKPDVQTKPSHSRPKNRPTRGKARTARGPPQDIGGSIRHDYSEMNYPHGLNAGAQTTRARMDSYGPDYSSDHMEGLTSSSGVHLPVNAFDEEEEDDEIFQELHVCFI